MKRELMILLLCFGVALVGITTWGGYVKPRLFNYNSIDMPLGDDLITSKYCECGGLMTIDNMDVLLHCHKCGKYEKPDLKPTR